MHHQLDIQPVPEKVIYINELNFLSPDLYGTDDEYKRALTGKKQSEGGILPEDNVRIYVPMDLNEDYIHRQYRCFPDRIYRLTRKLLQKLESSRNQRRVRTITDAD